MSAPNPGTADDRTDPMPRPTFADFATVDWQAIVARAPFRRLYELAGRFGEEARHAAGAGDNVTAAVFQSLADVCSLGFRVDRPNDPFTPWMVTQGFRTGGIEDLSQEAVETFSELAENTADPRVRARLGDVAWVRIRAHRAAKVAVTAYLSLADQIDPGGWPEEFPALQRALIIALQLGRGNEELRRVVGFIQELLARLAPVDTGFLCAKLMRLLLEMRTEDGARYATMAADIAQRALGIKEFHRAREYWALAAEWAGRAKDPEEQRSHLLAVAEAYVAEALEALLVFANYPPVPTVARLRETSEEHAKQYLLMSLFPKVFFSTEGKVVARQASLASDDPSEREAALRMEMLALAAQYHDTLPQMIIDPMRRQILSDHPLAAGDLLPLLEFNQLVPRGRERLFADGLVAGFYGDPVQATHLLAPQVEHAIRVLLQRVGERVSGLDRYGLQPEFGLNKLLYLPRLKEVLGEDVVFALQGLTVEPAGGNIRNRMAHGLMNDGEFYAWPVMYLWWLTLRLCLLPGLIRATEGARS